MSVASKILWFLFACIFLFTGKAYSQAYYRTINGCVLITGKYNDSLFLAESHKLYLGYNSVNKTIYGEINLQTFSSEIPYIDSFLNTTPTIVTINGYIPVDFLSWNHNEYQLDIPLDIRINQSKVNTLSKIKFTHVDKTLPYTCVMEASFRLKLSDFIHNIPKLADTTINVQFLQLILRRKNT